MIKYIELFAGIGGFRNGLENIINNREQQKNLKIKRSENYFKSKSNESNQSEEWRNFTCVYSNENNKYACQIYRKNFGEKELYEEDIRNVKSESIPEFEMLVGGFPCQSFSIAGNRKGMSGEDIRGTLFYEIYRIARDRQPKLLLLENVPGLLSSRGGEDFCTILRSLDEIGYDVEWNCLNSKNFGVPQNRERVFIIGHLRKERRGKIFPLEETNKFNNKQNKKISEQISNTLRTNYSNGFSNETYIFDKKGNQVINENSLQEITKNKPQSARVYKTIGISQTLSSNGGGLGAKTGLYAVAASRGRNGKQELEIRKDNITNSLTSVQKDNLIAPCIRAEHHNTADVHFIEDNFRIRRLTPTECERLQGFDKIEKYIIIKVCLDHQKKNVNAEEKNLKSQKYVGSAEKNNIREIVLSVENNLNTKHPLISKLAQQNVHINLGEKEVEILNQEKLLLYVSNVEKKKEFHPHIKIEDFALLTVGLYTTLEKIINNGGVELHQKEQYSIIQESGKKLVKLCGKEIMLPIEYAKKDLTILKRHLKSIMSKPFNIESLEQKLTTSFLYVISAIIGYIPKEIKNQDTFTIILNSKIGWTFGVSDSMRYKCLGNAVTTNVITAIGQKIMEIYK